MIETGANGNLNVEILDRLDNKLKDYLVLAQKKFPVSDSSNFNILVIAVDIISDMDEWYSYLLVKLVLLVIKPILLMTIVMLMRCYLLMCNMVIWQMMLI